MSCVFHSNSSSAQARVNSTFPDYDNENDCQKYSSLWWFSATSHSSGQPSLAAQHWISPVQSNSEFYSRDVQLWPAFCSSGPGLARVLMAINVCWDLTESPWSGRAPSTPLIHNPSHYSDFVQIINDLYTDLTLFISIILLGLVPPEFGS